MHSRERLLVYLALLPFDSAALLYSDFNMKDDSFQKQVLKMLLRFHCLVIHMCSVCLTQGKKANKQCDT